MRPLAWQTIQIPLGAGLDTKKDPRFSSPPSLDIARDVHFELIGGVQTRPPFAGMSNAIQGGGALTNCRRIDVVNGELVVFTDTALYSWNAQLAVWVNRGTHLAVKVDETPRFVTTGDQIDGDRAELAGTVVLAWTEGTKVFAAAMDKATGSVLVSPTAVSTAAGRPRLVALSTKILLFVDAGTGSLTARAIDPAAPATGIASVGTTVIGGGAFNTFYDVVRIASTDQCVGASRCAPTTSYFAFTVTAGLTVVLTTKSRTCDGPIAVSTPDANGVQVVRANGTAVLGDQLTLPALADSITGQAIGTAAGTPVNQIAACHRSVQNAGAFRCYVFWSAQESTSSCTWVSQFNWVDTAGTLGAAANFVRHHGVASRAFGFNGQVYVWMAFGGQSTFTGGSAPAFASVAAQNTYFLWRDDQFLANAKAVATHSGGLAPSTGHLPGISQVGANTYAWCATVRRRIDLGGNNHVGFAARAPVDVTIAFDDNSARRSARLGATLYISGGEILQYDGVRLVETGFHIYPWLFALIDQTGGGTVAPGAYTYKETWRYANAQGEIERSTTATSASVTVTGNSTAIPTHAPLTATHKTAVPPAVEIWRTPINPGAGAPFYLVTSNDPTVLTNPNRYIPNDPTLSTLPTFNDFEPDSTATTNETNPENGSVLESLSPPPAKIIVPTDTRLFLAGIAGDPDRLWYSRQRNDGEVAGFNDALTIDVPRPGGDITAIWFQDEVLYVGRQYAIYALPGVGFDNGGGGQNFGPARIVSPDVGPVSQEAQALTPIGTVFKSGKGWQLLDRSGQVRYVGGQASAFDGDTVLAMHVMASRHQVRILTNNRLLLWDYRGAVDATTQEGIGNWAEWTIADGVHATVWNGTYVYLTATGPKMEQAAFTGLTYGQDVESSWIKLADLQGWGRLGAVMVLGEYRDPFLLRVRLARDYQYDGAGNVVYYDDKTWTPSPAVAGSALQVRHTPSASNGNCEAVKVRLTAVTELARAQLPTSSALSPAVQTSGSAWAATWAAAAAFPGLMGNRVTMSIAFATGAVPSFDVRDHLVFGPATGRWSEQLNNVGVLVIGTTTTTVAQLEAAIAAASKLCILSAADATPGKTLAIATMAALSPAAGSFSGGTYGAPTGEALRLTGLGLEVGLRPGLNKRLPAAQKE